MWLFTKIGFFSVVACLHDDRKTVDNSRVCIRARQRHHLENLLNRFSSSAQPDWEIHESSNRDYRYRLIVLKMDWAQMLHGLTMDIDYSNFKDAVHDHSDDAYAASLHDVWQVMYELQLTALSKMSQPKI